MQIDDFKKTVTTFSDPGTELLFERNRVVLQVNGDVVEQSLLSRSGDIHVVDSGIEIPASLWIIRRLARLPLLASRLTDTIQPTKFFVSPAGEYLPSLTVQATDTAERTVDAVSTMQVAISDRSPLETSVIYLTSDAGEGKTSLIHQVARQQAEKFLDNKSDWLLVPIPLGGRHFLRFDDITVGALQNRYRFPFLYYNSFIALIKMGVIVPAFDGFEEMFVENSSGEAISAMGLLLAALGSKGAMVIAARKAYFDFENLRDQARLYDTIRTYSVGFSKFELERWGKQQFLEYCDKRAIKDSVEIYKRVSERLTPGHSLLTRPVLVNRLVNIAEESPSLDTFIAKVHASGPDFFSVFVRSIIEREANDKWIDRSGEIAAPLLSVEDHCELLAYIAMSMWEGRVDYLKRESLEFVTDYFSEVKHKSAMQSQQIRERIRGHALLVRSPNAADALEFDHEEFRLFFLGEALADQLRPLNDRAKSDVLNTLRRGPLPRPAQRAFARAIERDPHIFRLTAAKFLLSIASLDGQASFTHENCSSLVLRLLSGVPADGLSIAGLAFAPDALRDRKLSGITFEKCYFAATSLENTHLTQCVFRDCTLSEMRLYQSTRFQRVEMYNAKVDGVRLVERDIDVWEPAAVRATLERSGLRMLNGHGTAELPLVDVKAPDEELRDVEKLVRYFMRSTHIGESVIRIKLGNRGQMFIDQVAPRLLQAGVLAEIENRGEPQRRFKMGMPLELVNRAITTCSGSFNRFLELIQSGRSGV